MAIRKSYRRSLLAAAMAAAPLVSNATNLPTFEPSNGHLQSINWGDGLTLNGGTNGIQATVVGPAVTIDFVASPSNNLYSTGPVTGTDFLINFGGTAALPAVQLKDYTLNVSELKYASNFQDKTTDFNLFLTKIDSTGLSQTDFVGVQVVSPNGYSAFDKTTPLYLDTTNGHLIFDPTLPSGLGMNQISLYSVPAVPEPPAWAMLGTGLAGIGVASLLRRKRSSGLT